MRTKTNLIVILILLSMLVAGCAGSAAAQSLTATPESEEIKPVTRTLSVSGSGIAYITPDIAYVNIGVHTEGKDAARAVAENNSQTQEVSAAIKSLGVSEKDIQTTNFSIYPRQEYSPDGKPTGEITYIVDNSVYVTVRDLDKIGDLLNTVVKAGANSIYGIQFDVADKAAALSEARKAAMQNANTVAEELAAAAGLSLGAIQTINTSSSDAPTPVYVERAAVMADAAVPVSPGQMSITVYVSVVYEIR